MRHPNRVFAYQPLVSEMEKSNSVKSERTPMAPHEVAARIRRCARALQQGVEIKALEARGFSDRDIAEARAMIGKK